MKNQMLYKIVILAFSSSFVIWGSHYYEIHWHLATVYGKSDILNTILFYDNSIITKL